MKEATKRCHDGVSVAKSRWYAKLAKDIQNMAYNPKLAWKMIRILAGRDSSHHNHAKIMAVMTEDGDIATNDEDNFNAFEKHFSQVQQS